MQKCKSTLKEHSQFSQRKLTKSFERRAMQIPPLRTHAGQTTKIVHIQGSPPGEMTPEGLRHGTEGNGRNLYTLSLYLIEKWQNVGSHLLPEAVSITSPTGQIDMSGNTECQNTDPECSHSISIQVLFVDSLAQHLHLPQTKGLGQKQGQQKKRWEEHGKAERLAMWHILWSLQDQSTDRCCLLPTWGDFC